MGLSILEQLFLFVKNGACKLRKKNNNADGLKYWKPIKELLSQYDNVKPAKWKKISATTTDKYMSYPEYTIDGYGNQKIIEQNHFLIQQVRIPKQEKATIRKIIQLALNIGQLKGTSSSSFLTKIGYKKSNLDQLSSYISKNDIERLSKHISKDTVLAIKKIAYV